MPAPIRFWKNSRVFYVSSDGNDLNNGLSPSCPFKTIERVNQLGLYPGDKVLFRCGDEWYGSILRPVGRGTVDMPIYFGTYGGGGRPFITADYPLDGSHLDLLNWRNGGFESGLLDPWYAWYQDDGRWAVVEGEDACEGRYCLHLHADDTLREVVGVNNSVCGGGCKFTLKFFYKGVEGTFNYRVTCKKEDTTYYLQEDGTWSTTVAWLSLTASSDWQEHALDFTVLSGDVDMVSILFSVVSGDMWVDYVRLYPRWVEHASNIYKIALGQGSQYRSIHVGGRRLSKASSLDELTEEGLVYQDGYVYYVYNRENPENDVREFMFCPEAYTPNNRALDTSQIEYAVFEGIKFGCSSFSGGAVYLTSNNKLIDCEVIGNDRYAVEVEGRNIEVLRNVVHDAGAFGIIVRNNSEDVKVESNIVFNIATSKLDQEESWDGEGIAATDGVKRIKVRKNLVYNCGKYGKTAAIVVYSAEDVEVAYNKVYKNATSGIAIQDSNKVKVHHNVVYKNVITDMQINTKTRGGIVVTTPVEASGQEFDVEIAFNTISENDDVSGSEYARSGIFLYIRNNHTLKAEVYNNILHENYNSASTYKRELLYKNGGGTLEVFLDHNAYYTSSNSTQAIEWDATLYALDHIVGNTDGYFSYDTGHEKNAVVLDPLLDGCEPTLNSPVLNAGLNRMLEEVDFKGNPHRFIPCIGAVEYFE